MRLLLTIALLITLSGCTSFGVWMKEDATDKEKACAALSDAKTGAALAEPYLEDPAQKQAVTAAAACLEGAYQKICVEPE